MTLSSEARTSVDVAYPLDPLSRENVSQGGSVLKEGPAAAESFPFVSVELREPSKDALRTGTVSAPEADSVPRQQVGFMLQPYGFFDQNPTLDLPRMEAPSHNAGHCCESDGQ